jgi:hypothetical protein
LLRKPAIQQQLRDDVVAAPAPGRAGAAARTVLPRQAWPQAAPAPPGARENRQVTTLIQTRLSGIAAYIVTITKYVPEPIFKRR